MTRFARVLVRKSQRALKSARLDLTDRDYDSAVNRSYLRDVRYRAGSAAARRCRRRQVAENA